MAIYALLVQSSAFQPCELGQKSLATNLEQFALRKT